MRDIFYFLLILVLYVDLLQDVVGKPQGPQYNVVPKQTEAPLNDYDDTTEATANCYAEEHHCATVTNYSPKAICVYKKKLGLTNFFGMCTIKLQTCLINQQKKLNDGSASLDEEVFYNGKHFNCQYYAGNAKSQRQAVIWYFKLGGLDAEKENITQPFENIDDL